MVSQQLQAQGSQVAAGNIAGQEQPKHRQQQQSKLACWEEPPCHWPLRAESASQYASPSMRRDSALPVVRINSKQRVMRGEHRQQAAR